MDAMALVQRFGKPDIFLTVMCNLNWPEIKAELHSNQETQNRPDLNVHIFRAKLEELKIELFKKQIFGSIDAYVYVIEFQKRGLPHAHFLIILKTNAKLTTPVTPHFPHLGGRRGRETGLGLFTFFFRHWWA